MINYQPEDCMENEFFYQEKRMPTGTENVTGCSFRIVRNELPSGI